MMTVREYVEQDGRSPFRDWLRRLDVPIRARIQARILRFETGNLGDHKLLGDGVWEARLAFGPGYRLYFGKSGRNSYCYCWAATSDRRPRTSSGRRRTG